MHEHHHPMISNQRYFMIPANRLAALICFLALVPVGWGQTPVPAADANPLPATATSPAPAGQASDDVIKKLSDMIHAGKYTEAQQLTTGLLLAYPGDQRLTKAKTLLDKLLATAKPTDIGPSNGQSANKVAPIQPAANTNSVQLTGMDKVEYNSLIELGRQAQQTTDLDQQKILLHRFMDESKPFLEKHPNDLLLWQLRAASALSLDDLLAGYEAGQKLLGSGMADNDPNMQRLLSQLNLKGWLDKKNMEAQRKQDENAKKFSWLLGTWTVGWNYLGSSESRYGEDFQISGSIINGYQINRAGVRCTPPDLRGTILDSGEINWECYLPPADPDDLFIFRYSHSPTIGRQSRRENYYVNGGDSPDGPFYPSGWQPIISRDIHNGSMIIIIPSQSADPKSKKPMKNPVTLKFTKVGSMQNPQGSQQLPSKSW